MPENHSASQPSPSSTPARQLPRIFIFLLFLFAALIIALPITYLATTRAAPHTPRGPIASPRIEYEFRDQDTGCLIYILNSDRPAPIKAPSGLPIPARWHCPNFTVSYYLRDGRILHLRADNCDVEAAAIPPAKSLSLVHAHLAGNVVLTVSPSDPAAALKHLTTIIFDADADIDAVTPSLLTSSPVHVHSDTLDFRAAALQITINPKDQTAKFLPPFIP